MPNPNQLNHNINSSSNPLDSIEQPIDNQEYSVDNLEPPSNISEQLTDKELLSDKTRIQNELGAKTLSLIDLESKHKDIVENLDALIKHGTDANILVENMPPHVIAKNLNTLIDHGADVNILVKNMDSNDIANNFDMLIDYGTNIDINELLRRASYDTVVKNFDKS